MHSELAKHNAKIKIEGRGAIIRIGKTELKLSTIDRGSSFGKLEKRLGKYQKQEVYKQENQKHEIAKHKSEQEMIQEISAIPIQLRDGSWTEISQQEFLHAISTAFGNGTMVELQKQDRPTPEAMREILGETWKNGGEERFLSAVEKIRRQKNQHVEQRKYRQVNAFEMIFAVIRVIFLGASPAILAEMLIPDKEAEARQREAEARQAAEAERQAEQEPAQPAPPQPAQPEQKPEPEPEPSPGQQAAQQQPEPAQPQPVPQPEATPPPPWEKYGPAAYQQQHADMIAFRAALGADYYRLHSVSTEKEAMPGEVSFIFGAKAARDKGEQFFGYAPAALEAQYWRAVQRNEEKKAGIHVTPLAYKYHYILLDDIRPAALQQMKTDGLAPATITETSPGNFQAVLKIPRASHEDAAENAAAGRIAQKLNIHYGGDKAICSAEHTMRMPGTLNLKSNNYGHRATLHSAQNVTCEKSAQLLAVEVAAVQQEQAQRQPAPIRESAVRYHAPAHEATTPTVAAALYSLHASDISAKMAEIPGHKLDFHVAQRLQATGHSREEIAEIIRAGAPVFRPETDKNFQTPDYAKSVAAAAFGRGADAFRSRFANQARQWRRQEREIGSIYAQEPQNQKKKSQSQAHDMER